MRKMLLVILISLLGSFWAKPQEMHRDSIAIFFPVGLSQIEPGFRSNSSKLVQLVDLLNSNELDHIAISASASPDGNSELNANLAEARYQAIYDYIRNFTSIPDSLIYKSATGVAWDELRQLVADNLDTPCREDILRIIDNTPVWVFDANGQIIDGRKKQLMDLNGGDCYRWMLANVFPDLRSSIGVMLYTKDTKATKQITTAPASETKPIVIAAEKEQNAECGNSTVATVNRVIAVIDEDEQLQHSRTPVHRFAAKTNLIYDAALMPSGEFEWRINKNWSAAVEFDCAWWSRKETHRYYQLAMIVPEGRYWFRTSGPWRGMYAGIFIAGGKYDLENGDRGYKGHGAMIGVSYGYMWPISSCLSLEAAIGVGYLRTRFEEYLPFDGDYVYQRTRDYNFVGPVKLKFAIAWRFNDISKKGGSLL